MLHLNILACGFKDYLIFKLVRKKKHVFSGLSG